MTKNGPGGVTRRRFIGAVGATTVGAGLLGASEPCTPGPLNVPAGATAPVTVIVNGFARRATVEPQQTLLTLLREPLGLTGTKPGCERGECGACTVLVDGVPRYSCLTLALEADGREITTVEGLLQGEALSPVQEAFVEEDALQCGYCTPGQVMAAEGLLRTCPEPTLDEIRTGMSGNLCRCGAYPHIFRAVARASDLRKGGVR